ncbi:MAG: cation:proton antiporter, partial [Methanoregula sp.]
MEMMLAIVILISLAIALLYIGQHFKLPSIVSFLIIGILVGPFGFALITNQSAIEMVGQIGIILLLFTIGLEFSFEKLLRSWRIVIIGGLVQVCTTIVAITLVTTYFKMPFNEALVFGFIVSLSSTAIVMKILQERGEVDTIQGRTLLGILIFQDLAIIPM